MKVLFLISACLAGFSVKAQFGVIQSSERASHFYTLFHPHNNTDTYLIDSDGALLHQWEGNYPPGNTVYLLPDQRLFRTGKIDNNAFRAGGLGGYMELVNYDGDILWSYTLSNENEAFHHEAIFLENGNILAIVWESISKSDAIQMGRNPETLDDVGFWSEKIIEFEPVGTDGIELVWEWRAKDHLIQNFDESKDNYNAVISNPHKIDINYIQEKNKIDWIHLNSIDYLESQNLILLSSPFLNEVWVIDHSTTLEEARTSAGGDFNHGGDLLYRWGNPETYGQGSISDKKLFGQHNAQFVFNDDELGILLYNNGVDRPEGAFSSIDFISTPFELSNGFSRDSESPFGPTDAQWSLTSIVKEELYSRIVSGVQLLPNGNFFITEGINGRLLEMDSSGVVLWEYQSSHGSSDPLTSDFHCEKQNGFTPSIIFRGTKIAPDYTGLISSLEPESTLESINCPLGIESEDFRTITVYTTNGTVLKTFSSFTNEKNDFSTLPKNQLLIIKENTSELEKTYKLIIQNN